MGAACPQMPNSPLGVSSQRKREHAITQDPSLAETPLAYYNYRAEQYWLCPRAFTACVHFLVLILVNKGIILKRAAH